jgi:carbohydrate kinase (thermoresistant glucokinase family)
VVVFIIGAAGAGKTTVGQTLARELGWRFVEGDDYHAPESIAKMRDGIPLNDADRAPWLARLHAVAATAIDRREHAVIACSALKQRYRELLRGTLRGVRFVFLEAGEPTLRGRLEQRSHHFAGPALLASQIADLEEPADAVTVDATRPVAEIVATIRYELGL